MRCDVQETKDEIESVYYDTKRSPEVVKKNDNYQKKTQKKPRKHSSRMHTVLLQWPLGGGCIPACTGQGVRVSQHALRRGCIPACTERGCLSRGMGLPDTLLWTKWLTDRCKNITLPVISLNHWLNLMSENGWFWFCVWLQHCRFWYDTWFWEIGQCLFFQWMEHDGNLSWVTWLTLPEPVVLSLSRCHDPSSVRSDRRSLWLALMYSSSR